MRPNETVYVATRGDDAGMARWRVFMEQAEKLGLRSAYDWPAEIDRARAMGHTCDADMPPAFRAAISEAEYQAIVGCRFFVYLSPIDRSEGAACELGIAITASRFSTLGILPTTIVVGKPRVAFAALAQYHFDTEALTLDFIRDSR